MDSSELDGHDEICLACGEAYNLSQFFRCPMCETDKNTELYKELKYLLKTTTKEELCKL